MSVTANLNADHVIADAWQKTPAGLIDAIGEVPASYHIAASMVGLSDADYSEFFADLDHGNARTSAIPTHVDAMAGRRKDGSVYVLRDVRVPAHERGLRVVLRDGTRVYIPFKCGNPSIVHGAPLVDAFPVHGQPIAKAPSVPQASAEILPVQGYVGTPEPAPAVAEAPAGTQSSNQLTPALLGLAWGIGAYIDSRIAPLVAAPVPCEGGRSCVSGVH